MTERPAAESTARRRRRSLKGLSALPAALGALTLLPRLCAGDCSHENISVDLSDANALEGGRNVTRLLDGKLVSHSIGLGMQKQYYYENFNVTTMNQPDRYRKLIIALSPCQGVVYVLVRKTRPCWPDPHSCCQPRQANASLGASSPPCNVRTHTIKCGWTHFSSALDGSRDGAPSFFEVPLSATKYHITVFAPTEENLKYHLSSASYQLLALADIGAYPRPGLQGKLTTRQVDEMTVTLLWEEATFVPAGVSTLRYYHIYSSLLTSGDGMENSHVLLDPGKTMNTYCGLEKHAVRYGTPLTSANCRNGVCNATITGVVPRKRYMFNVVAQSARGFNSTYSGTLVTTEWHEDGQVLSDRVTALIAATCGTVFGVVLIGYLWIVKLYN